MTPSRDRGVNAGGPFLNEESLPKTEDLLLKLLRENGASSGCIVPRSLGIALHRRSACIAAVESHGSKLLLHQGRRLPRSPQEIVDLLKDLPPGFERAPLSIALSPSLLACADAWPRPEAVKPSALRRHALNSHHVETLRQSFR